MTTDVEKLRSAVEDLLEKNKALTEKEVKAAASRMTKIKISEIGAGIIRAVRKKMKIDRPTALAYARQVLAKDPLVEARTVIEAVGERFGIRLGPPDVSRLRPEGSRRPRRKSGARAASVVEAGVAGAAGAARPARRGRRSRKATRASRARAGATALASGSAPVPAALPEPRTAGASPRPAPAAVAIPLSKGEIAMTFEGRGAPDELARFFLSLANG